MKIAVTWHQKQQRWGYAWQGREHLWYYRATRSIEQGSLLLWSPERSSLPRSCLMSQCIAILLSVPMNYTIFMSVRKKKYSARVMTFAEKVSFWNIFWKKKGMCRKYAEDAYACAQGNACNAQYLRACDEWCVSASVRARSAFAYLSLRLVTTTLFAGAIFAYTIPLAMDKPKLPHPRTAMVVLGSICVLLGNTMVLFLSVALD